ncbi:MAG TPA: hypothetical protein VGT79_03970 [Xanthomonadaceae bacterium]|nr:hypothetical protein [Xanthomonadaceae bacterium]
MLRVILLVAVGLWSGGVQAETVVPLVVGGQEIRFGVDDHYVRASKKMPNNFALASAGLPPGNRLVEMFVAKADVKRMLMGQPLENQYLQVQALRDAESTRFSDADWQTLRPALIRQSGAINADAYIKNMQAGMGKRLSETSGSDVTLKFGEVGKPQLYGNDPRSVRFTMLVPIKGSINGVQHSAQIECAGSITLLNKKMVYIYAYESYREDDKDMASLRATLDHVVDRAESLNAPAVKGVTR